MRYPEEQTERLATSGETIRFNTEITGGMPYISYHHATGTFIIEKMGKYIVSYTLHVADLAAGEKTQLHLVINGRKIVSHDIVAYHSGTTLFSFTDVIQTTEPDSELSILNSGQDIRLSGLPEDAASVNIIGLV
jgi:hypothetical protein